MIDRPRIWETHDMVSRYCLAEDVDRSLDARDAKIARLREALGTIADFAVGNGDVCEIIARRARAALEETKP